MLKDRSAVGSTVRSEESDNDENECEKKTALKRKQHQLRP